jgi:hypothetical protein
MEMIEGAIEACKIGFESGNFTGCPAEIITGGIIGGLIVAGIFVALLFLAAVYVYSSLAWFTIGKKLKYAHRWLAWVPIASWGMILQLGGFHWALVFLVLVPVLGWIALFVLLIIARWRIYDKRKQPGWFSLGIIIPEVGGLLHLIAIGLAAWNKK